MSGGGEVKGRDNIWGGKATPLCRFNCWEGEKREGELWRRASIFCMPMFAEELLAVTVSGVWGCDAAPKK